MTSVRPQWFADVHPDAARIVALSAAIALNAAALIAAMRPMVADITLAQVTKPFDVAWHEVKPPPPPPPPMDPPPPVHAAPHTATALVVPRVPPAVPVTVPTEEGSQAVMPPQPLTITSPSTNVASDATPSGLVTLAYVAAPAPKYPTAAIRMHMTGTVVLRVLVDETGKPIDVVVESSSGHEVLDRAASEQVLSRWTFQPAQSNGQQIKAWARVPVTFDLRGV
ncbi:protein TonB [Luteibacter sp. Sphag1AF]|uniref:energy transducer TonB n=1 Tax=Luteibacter sp. Sphag1AF TaxID=2587031 RepID=UPI001613ACF4|nr:energy transducer TonB [Luteibacter sp. Sphag1AF]MBB3225969.1 protein TonB [Luteibacter sp. Sphag1AF]